MPTGMVPSACSKTKESKIAKLMLDMEAPVSKASNAPTAKAEHPQPGYAGLPNKKVDNAPCDVVIARVNLPIFKQVPKASFTVSYSRGIVTKDKIAFLTKSPSGKPHILPVRPYSISQTEPVRKRIPDPFPSACPIQVCGRCRRGSHPSL